MHFVNRYDEFGQMAELYMVEGDQVYAWDPIAGYYTRHHTLTDEQVEHLLAAASEGCVSVTFSAEAEEAAWREGWIRAGSRYHRPWR